MVVVEVKDKKFYLDDNLRKRLDNVKHIVRKKNFDCVILIDGLERVGKSTLALTCGYYLSDGDFTINNVAVDSADAKKKIEELPDKSVLVIDEGSLVFNSKDSTSKIQKDLIKIINVVGQKNMIFIVVLPSIFDLNKTIAVRRSRFLLHCYTDPKLNRGRFGYFGEDKKKKLYLVGKKNYDSYSFPKLNSSELGRYVDFNPLGEEYIEAKKKSLYSSLHEEQITIRDVKKELLFTYINNLDKLFKELKLKINQETIAKVFEIERSYVSKILNFKKIENPILVNV